MSRLKGKEKAMMSTMKWFAAVLAAAFALSIGLAACDDAGQQGGTPPQGEAPAGEQQAQ